MCGLFVTMQAKAARVSIDQTQTPLEFVGAGSGPVRPLRAPKHNYFSMHPEPQPMKIGGPLDAMDLFGSGSPAEKGPVLPEFDTPVGRPGFVPWTPLVSDPRGMAAGSSVPEIPAPGSLVVLGVVAAPLLRRRR